MKMNGDGPACDGVRSWLFLRKERSSRQRWTPGALDVEGSRSSTGWVQREARSIRNDIVPLPATTPVDLIPTPENQDYAAVIQNRRCSRRSGQPARAELPRSVGELHPRRRSAHSYPPSHPANHSRIYFESVGKFDSHCRSAYSYQSPPPANHSHVQGELRTKCIIPCFDGNLFDEDYLEWEQEVENFLDCTDMSQEKFVRNVIRKLIGRAAAWWYHLTQARYHEGRSNVKTWSKMKRLMRSQFLSSSNDLRVPFKTSLSAFETWASVLEIESYFSITENVHSKSKIKLSKREHGINSLGAFKPLKAVRSSSQKRLSNNIYEKLSILGSVSDDLSKDKNSEEVYSFQSTKYECGGAEEVESRGLDCQHIASEINQDQNLKLDRRNAASIDEANNLQGEIDDYPTVENTLRHRRMSKHLCERLQMELVKNSKDSRLASHSGCGASGDSPTLLNEGSSAKEHISDIRLASCSTNIRVESSGFIQEAINRETEADSKEKDSDPKVQPVPFFSHKKLFPWSYDWHRDRLHLKDGTKNPSVTVLKCKSGPVDHDAIMKALARALEITEEAYADMVEKALDRNPELALMGSCVLVMLMKDEDVYVMNLGDSRVVLAQDSVSDPNVNAVLTKDDSRFQNRSRESIVRVELDRISEEFPMRTSSSHVCSINKNHEISICKLKLTVIRLSTDHSTSIEEEVLRIKAEHVDDPQAVLNGRVKGQLKVTRAFGAEFLKQPKFNDANFCWDVH